MWVMCQLWISAQIAGIIRLKIQVIHLTHVTKTVLSTNQEKAHVRNQDIFKQLFSTNASPLWSILKVGALLDLEVGCLEPETMFPTSRVPVYVIIWRGYSHETRKVNW